jgi:hypothetical protein
MLQCTTSHKAATWLGKHGTPSSTYTRTAYECKSLSCAQIMGANDAFPGTMLQGTANTHQIVSKLFSCGKAPHGLHSALMLRLGSLVDAHGQQS